MELSHKRTIFVKFVLPFQLEMEGEVDSILDKTGSKNCLFEIPFASDPSERGFWSRYLCLVGECPEKSGIYRDRLSCHSWLKRELPGEQNQEEGETGGDSLNTTN